MEIHIVDCTLYIPDTAEYIVDCTLYMPDTVEVVRIEFPSAETHCAGEPIQ